MRPANREQDYWELRSAEESHQQNPDSFWIPPLEERQNLRRGHAARLIFDIESEDEDGGVEVQGERMWVIVAERYGDFYIGILDNQPASIEPSEDTYLCFGAEVAFLPEHVTDVAEPPSEYIDWQLSQTPERKWPRE